MPFGRLLKKAVAESNKTSKEIIEECNKLGKKIDKSYFSKMLNEKVPAPSEELTRVLAKVCNFNEELLVLENYLDKAPVEIREALINLKKAFSNASLNLFDNYPEEIKQAIENEINNEPLSTFIMNLLNTMPKMNYNSIEEKFSMEDDILNVSIKDTLAINVSDNGMSPLIPEGAKIRTDYQKSYNFNDILAIKFKNTDKLLLRYVESKDNKYVLRALNKEYKPQTVKKEDIIILGKVSKYIIEL